MLIFDLINHLMSIKFIISNNSLITCPSLHIQTILKSQQTEHKAWQVVFKILYKANQILPKYAQIRDS